MINDGGSDDNREYMIMLSFTDYDRQRPNFYHRSFGKPNFWLYNAFQVSK